MKFNAEIIRCGVESFGRQRNGGKEVPVWNENVKQHYAQYREAFHNWRQMGSEQQGDSAVHMRVSRARFKLALQWCKKREGELRKNALTNKLAESDTKGFWKNVRAMINTKTKLSYALDGIEGDSNKMSVYDWINQGL